MNLVKKRRVAETLDEKGRSYAWPVGRKGTWLSTWVKSDEYMFVSLVIKRRWFRKPVAKISFWSEGEMLQSDTGLWDRSDVDVPNPFEAS